MSYPLPPMQRMCAYQNSCYRSASTSSMEISIDGKVPTVKVLTTTEEDITLCKEKFKDWFSAQDTELQFKSLSAVKADELQLLSHLMQVEINRRTREEPGYKAPKSPWSHPCCPFWGPFTVSQVETWKRQEILHEEPEETIASTPSKKPARTPIKCHSPGMRKLISEMREDTDKRRRSRISKGSRGSRTPGPSPLCRQI